MEKKAILDKKSVRDLGLLVIVCLIAALLLAVVNQLTEGPIRENASMAEQQTRLALFPDAVNFVDAKLTESGVENCYQAVDAAGSTIGYVAQTTVSGYGGEILVTVGFAQDGAISGISVGGPNFSETAGLGAKSKTPEFTEQFTRKRTPLTLIKGGKDSGENTIDAISGATITSTAVTGGVNTLGKAISGLTSVSSPDTASAKGFGGPVAVKLTLDDKGAISDILIGDAYFNETEGYGAKALEAAFQQQFIGMTPPVTLEGIDAISGATYTSRAVVEAINLAYAQLTGTEAAAEPKETVTATQNETGAWTARAQGFNGPVAVKLTLDADNVITAISIGDKDFAESEYYGEKALEDSYAKQFIGKKLPLAEGDVDGISGATATTNALLTSIDAISQAVVK